MSTSLVTLVTKIYDFAYRSHEYFASAVWPKYPDAVHILLKNEDIAPAYHTQYHVQAVDKALQALFQNIPSNDCCNLQTDLNRYLEKFSPSAKEFISENFQDISRLAFAAHDLGNITEDPDLYFTEEVPRLNFASYYRLEDGIVEERSASILEKLIDLWSPPDNRYLDDIKQVVRHIIMQTVFHPSAEASNSPLWLFVQTVDQIGANYCLEVPFHQATSGYLNELSVSRGIGNRLPPTINSFVNFLPMRMRALYPDSELRHRILDIFDPNVNGKLQRRSILDKIAEAPNRPVDFEKDIRSIYEYGQVE